MVLSEILKEPGRTFTIIEDDNTTKGDDIYKAILKSYIENTTIKKIHLLCFNESIDFYKKDLKNEKVEGHDFSTDLSGWITQDFDISFKLNNILKYDAVSESPVMIDSLNVILLLYGSQFVYQFLQKLKVHFTKVVCQLHRDLVESNEVLGKLKFFANIYLSVSHGQGSARKNLRILEVQRIKSNGKVVSSLAAFRIDSNYEIISEALSNKNKQNNADKVRDSLKKLTTFRLGLDIKENEKIAKSNLILPYLRTDDEGQKDGKIIYEADAEDDLEDDPDEDLDI